MSQFFSRTEELTNSTSRDVYCHRSRSYLVEGTVGSSTGRLRDLNMVLTMCDTTLHLLLDNF